MVGDRALFGFFGEELRAIEAASGDYRVTIHVDGASYTGKITIRDEVLVSKN